MEKGQSAVEFFMITGALLFFVVGFLAAINFNIYDRNIDKIEIQLNEVAKSIQDEINLASESTEGYWRTFQVPENIGTRDLIVEIVDEGVYVKTDDDRFATSYSVRNVTGEIKVGPNNITKRDGIVYLNP
jgi:hypothetical protein